MVWIWPVNIFLLSLILLPHRFLWILLCMESFQQVFWQTSRFLHPPPVQLCLHMTLMLLTPAIWYKCLQKVQTALDLVIQMFWQQSKEKCLKMWHAVFKSIVFCSLAKMKVENSLRDLSALIIHCLNYVGRAQMKQCEGFYIDPFLLPLDNVKCLFSSGMHLCFSCWMLVLQPELMPNCNPSLPYAPWEKYT